MWDRFSCGGSRVNPSILASSEVAAEEAAEAASTLGPGSRSQSAQVSLYFSAGLRAHQIISLFST